VLQQPHVADGAVDQFVVRRPHPGHDIVFVASQPTHEESAVRIEHQFQHQVGFHHGKWTVRGLPAESMVQRTVVQHDAPGPAFDAEDMMQCPARAAAAQLRQPGGKIITMNDLQSGGGGHLRPVDRAGPAMQQFQPCRGRILSRGQEKMAP
jgi:hypothetical protein